MSQFSPSLALTLEQLQATLNYASLGPEPSQIVFYDDQLTTLATVVLTSPPGNITDAVLTLTQAQAGGDLIAATGLAVIARWFNGNGDLVASGAVTDPLGDGPFVIEGSDGTRLIAGGRVLLGLTEIT